jgi:hypothetical protein
VLSHSTRQQVTQTVSARETELLQNRMSATMFRNIIWEVDGTLFDTYPAIDKAFSDGLFGEIDESLRAKRKKQ